ncbi:MAG: hypothetical protein PVF05_07895 [Gemmatimonadales bacterium]|jgi:hypothetical protein
MSPHDDDLPRPPARLSSEELERVIRRAAELQTAREALPEQLDDQEVLRIGAEVGLQESHVRRALLELRAEAMVPEAPDDRSMPHRLWGEAYVQASRVVPGSVEDVQARLEEYLHSGESLRQVRNRHGLSIWEPAADVVSQIRRGLDLSGHGYTLARAKRLQVATEPLEAGRSLVTVTADMRNQRAEHGGGFLFGAGATTLGGSLALTLAAGLPVLLVVPALGVLTGGGGIWIAKRLLRSEREKMHLAIEGLLDRLESGDRPPAGRSGLMDRIQGLITEGDR